MPKKAKTADIVLPVLNAAKLKELYATMVKCRMLAERIQQSKHKQAHPIPGLEATLVGAGAHLLPQDFIALEHAGFLASLIKGTPLPVILARIEQSLTNNGSGNTASSLPVAGDTETRSMAKGIALAREQKGKGTVTLMFGTHEAGAPAFEPAAMALAAMQKLPIVCLVESSFDSRAESHVPPVPSDSHGVGSGYYPKITVDGRDVVAVFRVAQEAIRRAREGHGPALIECMTAHSGEAEKDSGGKKPAQHTAHDPLLFMEKYLRRKDLWSTDWSRRMIKEFTKELDEAFAGIHEKTALNAAFDNVYPADSGTPHSANVQS